MDYCPHTHTELVTTGSRSFSGGVVDDNLETETWCRDCCEIIDADGWPVAEEPEWLMETFEEANND